VSSDVNDNVSNSVSEAALAPAEAVPVPIAAKPFPLTAFIAAVIIAFLLGTGLGFVIGIKSGVPSPAVVHKVSGVSDNVSERALAPAETNVESNRGLTPPAPVEEKKEEVSEAVVSERALAPAVEEPKKDKKSAVLDELGTILSEEKK
jgi:hypothetical protein